jgi:hypothetical protein
MGVTNVERRLFMDAPLITKDVFEPLKGTDEQFIKFQLSCLRILNINASE